MQRAWGKPAGWLVCTLPVLAIMAVALTAQLAAAAPVTDPPLASPAAGLPLLFEANVGQTAPDVAFLARGQGYGILVTPDGMRITLRASAGSRPGPLSPRTRPPRGEAVTVGMTLAGAHATAPEAFERGAATTSYFVGADPGRWRAGIPTFGRIVQRGVYPGVDLVYYGRGGRLEYDFVLAPGADPAAIRLAFDVPVEVDGGDLVLGTRGGTLRLKRPVAYQEIDGTRRPVEVGYAPTGPSAAPTGPSAAPAGDAGSRSREVALAVATWDRRHPLVIDPVLDYSGYFGGAGLDGAMAIAADPSGNLYVTGFAESVDPATPGTTDAFVLKLPRNGVVPEWVAYLGGEADDGGLAIAVDAAGAAHVAGSTDSTGFPTQNGYQSTPQGGGDGFVAKLAPGGGSLLHASYLGGTGLDVALGIALDALGRMVVTGFTDSTDFPALAPIQTDRGGRDAFVATIDPALAGTASLVRSTYLGGTGSDEGHAVAVDGLGGVVVVGLTTSDDFPVTPIRFQGTRGGGTDAFVARLDPTGTSLAYVTYFGGLGDDAAFGVAVDSANMVHVTGATASSNFPLKFQSQAAFGGGTTDAFFARFNPAATTSKNTLLHSTFFGGNGDDAGHAVGVNGDIVAYVAGTTTSTSLVPRGGLQPPGGGSDAFVAKFNPQIEGDASLVFWTPLGGSGDDEAYGIVVDAAGQVGVAGLTQSSDFPRSGGGLGTALAGTQDAFITRLVSPDLTVPTFTAPATAGVGVPLVVTDTTRNVGDAAAPASVTGFFLSVDNKLTDTDPQIGSRAVSPLAPATEETVQTTLAIPAGTAPGTYFLFAKADSTGALDEALEGNNRFRRTIVVGPDVTVTSLSVVVSGTTVTVTDSIRNAGGGPTGPFVTRYYVSADATLDAGDAAVGSRALADVAPGATSTASTVVTLPDLPPGSGYRLFAVADADGQVAELSETNNTASATLSIGADLIVSAMSFSSSVPVGAPLTITDTTLNQGAAQAGASVTRFYLSADNVLDTTVDTFLGVRAVPVLAAGASSPGTLNVTLPTTPPGTYFVIALADADGTVTETSETNNVRTRQIHIGPDLIVTAVSAPATAMPGGTITVTDTVKNNGFGTSPPSTTVFFLSRDTVLDAADRRLGGRAVPDLLERKTHSGTTVLTVPADIAPGIWYVIAKADGDDLVAEGNDSNNTMASAGVTIGPDLAVTGVSVALSAGTVTVTETTMNTGGAPAGDSVTRFYLSTDATLDAGDRVLGERTVGPLAVGASSTASTPLPLPANLSGGTYVVLVVADAAGTLTEVNEGNNTVVSASMQLGPDLALTSLGGKQSVAPGAQIALTHVTTNVGTHPTPATTTRFFLSTDATLDPLDRLLASVVVPALGPGETSTLVTNVLVPASVAVGRYTLIVRANAEDTVAEITTANNLLTKPLIVGFDLTVTLGTVPSAASAGSTMTIGDTTTNAASGHAPASTTRFYLSRDRVVDAADVVLGNRAVPTLTGGASNSGTTSVTVPADTAPGDYWVIAVADAGGVLLEAIEDNNVASKPLRIGSDLIVSALSVPTRGGAGAAINVTDTAKNQAGGTAAASTTRFFLSTDAVLSPDDAPLGSRPVPALGAGLSNTATTALVLPAGIAPGVYYVIALADADGIVPEVDETNNTRTGGPMTVGADLVVSSLVTPATASATLSVAITDTTTNQGGGAAGASVTRYYLSTDAVLDAGDLFLGSRAVPALAAGASSNGGLTVTLPPGTAGVFHVIAVADAADVVSEADSANNMRIKPGLKVGPDLMVSLLNAPGGVGPGTTFSIQDTTRNSGPGNAAASTTRYYFARGTTIDADSIPLGSRSVPALAPNGTSTATVNVSAPGSLAVGNWNLIAVADAAGVVPEVDEGNNTRLRAMIVGPDLIVNSVTAPASASVGASIPVGDATRNAGGGNAAPSTTRIYLSTDGTPGGVLLGSRPIGTLAPNTSATGTTTVVIPADTVPANYFIVVVADADAVVAELDETNNSAAVAIRIDP